MALTMVKPEEMEAQAGTKLPPGEWFEVDQERINTFADCTEDHQFIHIDEAAAAQTPFGGTIAPGEHKKKLQNSSWTALKSDSHTRTS